MEFVPGMIRASDIGDGVMLAGTVPVPRFRRFEGSSENAALVFILNGSTVITSLDCGNVKAGDRIICVFNIQVTKGAVAGRTTIGLGKESGTADVRFANDQFTQDIIQEPMPANEMHEFSLMTVGKVLTDGSLVLSLRGTSAGSDSTAANGLAQLYAWVIPGS